MTTIKKVNETPGRVFSHMRWSSEPQSWGDSQQRQLQAAEAWYAGNGTKRSDEKFIDRGVSAWRGKNMEKGDLGRLLKTVRKGDVVLVEDNDRLSRQDWFAAMDYASQQKMVARRRFTASIKYVNNSLFTGLCKCALCGGSLKRSGPFSNLVESALVADAALSDERCR